jgi:hypothetical protein
MKFSLLLVVALLISISSQVSHAEPFKRGNSIFKSQSDLKFLTHFWSDAVLSQTSVDELPEVISPLSSPKNSVTNQPTASGLNVLKNAQSQTSPIHRL